MALTIPASDLKGTELNAIVANLTTLIAANPLNIALINQQYQAQFNLAQYLLANGYVVPSVLNAGSAPTYVGSAGGSGGAVG